MRPGYRPIAGVLCAALLLWSSGCTSSEERAASETQTLYPGMTMQEVADQLGNPAQVIKGDAGSETVWIYRYEGGGASVAVIVILTVLFVALLVAVAMAGGGGSFNGGINDGGGDGPPCQIRIRFGGDGRLLDVSPPEPVPGG